MEPITFVSDSEPYVVKGLVPGIYALEEVEAPVGYVTSNSKIIFEVLETGKIQKVSLESDFVSISVTDKKLVIDTKGVDGYKFNLKNSSGVLISEIEVDKDGYTSDELENGDYSLEEVEVPDGNIKIQHHITLVLLIVMLLVLLIILMILLKFILVNLILLIVRK